MLHTYLVFSSSNKIYLDFTDIHTIHLSAKLSYYYLEPYNVEKKVGLMSYRLKLPLSIRRLYLAFHIIKLMAAAKNLILG